MGENRVVQLQEVYQQQHKYHHAQPASFFGENVQLGTVYLLHTFPRMILRNLPMFIRSLVLVMSTKCYRYVDHVHSLILIFRYKTGSVSRILLNNYSLGPPELDISGDRTRRHET